MTSYQDPNWQPAPKTPVWAVFVATLIVATGIAVAAIIYFSPEDSETTAVAVHHPRHAIRSTQPETRTLVPPPQIKHSRRNGGGVLGLNAEGSFESLASSLPAQVGLAVQPLGGGPVREFGSLRKGHAWSSIKVPILATVMREQGESLSPEEKEWATRAVTASDNEAAAALFGQLENRDGGLDGASRAVEAVLGAAGDPSTVVSTEPPPPGAVSTYGQTDWSLLGSIQFYGSLARCELLSPNGTSYVEGLMEGVIPEERWGLGEAGFPSDWSVGMKGGWGPEASAGGDYLVRQSGFVRQGNRGIVVAMMAMDQSGSYPGGAADLTKIAQWLANELHGFGDPISHCSG